MTSIPTCAVCGGTGKPCYAAAEYRMFRCGTCHTAFVHPMPTSEALSHFYSTFHRSADSGGWYDEVENRMQQDFPVKVALVKRSLPSGRGRVLDVGCGKGFFVRACVDAGLDAEGIDLSDTAVEYARQQLQVKATAGVLADRKSELGKFSCITFWATIEHVLNPLGVLRDIYDLLEPGGDLLLDTGIGNDWLDRVLPGVCQWYDPPQHLYVFSDIGLRKALHAVGFEVIRHDRCFDRTPVRRIVRLVRNGVAAPALRFAAALGQLRWGQFCFTRFPVGNLQSITARRGADS